MREKIPWKKWSQCHKPSLVANNDASRLWQWMRAKKFSWTFSTKWTPSKSHWSCRTCQQLRRRCQWFAKKDAWRHQTRTSSCRLGSMHNNRCGPELPMSLRWHEFHPVTKVLDGNTNLTFKCFLLLWQLLADKYQTGLPCCCGWRKFYQNVPKMDTFLTVLA